MAKAIKQINKVTPSESELQAQALLDVVKAVGENREAILAMLDIFKHLHEMGLLKMIQALLEQRTDVGAIAIQQVNQPAMHHVIKNGINVFKFLGAIDPEQLQTVLQTVFQGFERFSESAQKGESPSLWKISTSLRQPEVRTSLSTMIDFLQGMGESLNTDERQLT